MSSPPVDTAHHKTTTGSGHPDKTGIEKRVQALVAKGSPKAAASPEVSTKQSPGDSPMRGGAATVPSCVREAISRSESPLAVEDGIHYRDDTGYLVVLPHAGGEADSVDAYIVDASCVTGDSSGPGDVLLQRTYPRR